jgi:hypothetical protein
MPRKIFGRKREELIGNQKKLHIEKLLHLCSPQNKIPAIKERRTRRWDMWHLSREKSCRQGFDGRMISL